MRLAVVGGGTAGWLSALVLQDAAGRLGLELDLAVVESTGIPTVGVGEGTTAVFRGFLLQLGLDELEFLRETGATIEYGIRHRDWRNVDTTYDGPIDDPHTICPPAPDSDAPWLDQYSMASGRPVSDYHLFTHLMNRSRAPLVLRPGRQPLAAAPFHHAYHFDQALVGRYLRRKAGNVTHLDAVVSGVRRDGGSGDIRALVLEGGGDLPVDFVIDCTGFRRTLICGAMGAKWNSYGSVLPVNRAMPFWLPHDRDGDIPPYTLARAMGSGWMWQIPTQTRMGCGYVYSDLFLTPEEAQSEVENALGRSIEPRNDIRINSGRVDRAWIGNCLAAGLAQSFFEPLEATSIHGTVVQMLLFTQFHLKPLVRGQDPLREAYNEAVGRQVDDFRSFINIHYVSERRDTPFWRHVDADCIPEDARLRLRQWAARTPRRSDFTPLPGDLPHVMEQLYNPVLDGLGLLRRNTAKAELAANPKVRAHARRTSEKLKREFRLAAARMPGHREFLEALHGQPPEPVGTTGM